MKNGFPISQLEIDDKWVTEHGDLTPDPKKFPNMAEMTKQLHDMGIKVTIWTHPFFNIESESLQETLPSKTFTDYDDEDKRDFYVKAGQERYHRTVVPPNLRYQSGHGSLENLVYLSKAIQSSARFD